MRLLGILIGGVLCAAVVAQGAYIMKTRGDIDALNKKLDELSVSPSGAGDERGGDHPAWGDDGERGGRRMPPPEFVPVVEALGRAVGEAGGLAAGEQGALPLPAALATPEARAQLRDFVSAQISEERVRQRERQMQEWRDRESRAHDEIATKLGLTGSDAARFGEILSEATARRQALMGQMREGGGPPTPDMRAQMRSIREETDTQLKSFLGEDRFKQYEDMRGDDRRGWRGGGPGGGGPRGEGPGPAMPGAGAPRGG
jgi:hypothetical protein